ncbi:methyltransferase domain-containing protein [Pseudodesulfovibrio sp.]|uniref:methyltransferase domain-containing protein n=1 Tax=unclassified Pseudodesulfovibrio TaxID=2661612 RepID=UPI003B005FC4
MKIELISKLYAKILGHPFFYDHIRYLIVGGQDETEAYKRLNITDEDIVLDVGCSTGVFFNNCGTFREYHGLDIDEISLEVCKQTAQELNLTNCHFYSEYISKALVKKIRPTKVVLGGILHFLPDYEVHTLFDALIQSDRLQGIVSYDAAYYQGKYINNFFSYMTRGQHNRHPLEYIALAEQHHIKVIETFNITTGNGAMTLHGMHMTPPKNG